MTEQERNELVEWIGAAILDVEDGGTCNEATLAETHRMLFVPNPTEHRGDCSRAEPHLQGPITCLMCCAEEYRAKGAAALAVAEKAIQADERKNAIVVALRHLPSDDDRLDVMIQFCRVCGSNDPQCYCTKDE